MPLLKYEQIAEDLRARIAAGEFGPGELLPSGRDLAERWSVSRATVVKAYDVLRADGLVVARQGAGFTVVETPVARPAGRRRAGTSRITGGAPYRRLGMPDRLVPPPHVGAALALKPGEQALRRKRLVLLEDGSPGTLVTAWFPPDIADAAPRLSLPGPLAEGTTHYVRRETGRSPREGVDVTTVRLADNEEAMLLEVEQPAAVAVVLHTAYDDAHRPLVCEEGVTPAHVFEETETYPMG
ncbi:GntR family transcriptional regulator [Streptomyces thermodiastaticus]|jgi:GntR family transcriptional regulator|uniref:GntR family transcriptional regulator n=1 Tax=Streptomyces thermodiastaticus TaxID=44061 RepID=UPI00167BAE1B|nr:GntR family transcriptional regulator [Streptomyces thermodiastaticus]MCE7553421.1 GntR family transcriptional regulator [Streptomyces thermodiastaticus]GHF96862.1 GntR family transcriptional regulator [Streptomyces thermodiastaticus]